MRVLGISAFHHASAAALVVDGRLIAAVAEGRFTRNRQDGAFPHRAVRFCLGEAGLRPDQVDLVAINEIPSWTFERRVETCLAVAPRGWRALARKIPLWLDDTLFQRSRLIEALEVHSQAAGWDDKLVFVPHLTSHAASAFFASPFDEAAVLALDGVGEWATTTAARGSGNRLETIKELRFPHSLGALYSAFTSYLGFGPIGAEHMVSGLAAHGEAKFADVIMDKVIDVKADGSFRLDLNLFDLFDGDCRPNRRFERLFGLPARQPRETLSHRHVEFAASIQAVTEEVMLRLARGAAEETGARNLCMAGGVALNSVANGKILEAGIFDRIWVPAAPGAAGGTVGAALWAYHRVGGHERNPGKSHPMDCGYLGPAFNQREIERRLGRLHARFTVLGESDLLRLTVEALAEGKAVGWFQGRMELGPKALGNRSILADPRSATMHAELNHKIKFRPSFRPFALSVPKEDAPDWFDLAQESPSMALSVPVAAAHRRDVEGDRNAATGGHAFVERMKIARSDIPAGTHVDGTARVQTVAAGDNPRFHALLQAFKGRTGCPVLVNASFNVRGEPMVCTPEDAFRCFMGSDIDVLVVGDCLLRKEAQDSSQRFDYKDVYRPD